MKLGSDLNQMLTKDENWRQDIIQTVELAHCAFPKATKKCFTLQGITASSNVAEILYVIECDARHIVSLFLSHFCISLLFKKTVRVLLRLFAYHHLMKNTSTHGNVRCLASTDTRMQVMMIFL